jgi:cytochrome b6-f complex iron-sulfur subunit
VTAPTHSASAPALRELDLPTSGVTRRELMRSTLFGSMGILFATALGGAGGMVWPIKISGFGGIVQVPTPLSEIKIGDVMKVREGKFYLTRTNDGLMALYWKCVHLGCTVPWVEANQRFECPCHQSMYQITGQNVSGPATHPLDYMEIQIENGKVNVDTGKIHTRTRYEPKQAVRV